MAIQFPVLNIYLGTSAGKVGRQLKAELDLLPERDREKVAHLFIDTAVFGGGSNNVPAADREQILVPQRIDIALRTGIAEERLPHIRMGEHRPSTTAAGAGGVRNNGHVALWYDVRRVREKLNAKLGSIVAPRLAQHGQELAPLVRVNLVSYLGGGTGSGILPSLILLTQNILESHSRVHNLFLYLTLPEQFADTTLADPQRARANSLACLLELLAISMKATASEEGYMRWISDVQVFLHRKIADRIFLYNQTGAHSEDQLARIVAMDVMARILDGQGVGIWETRQLPDIDQVDNLDDRQLPAMFSTSCPMEIVFPTRHTARGFGLRMARYLLQTMCFGYEKDMAARRQKRQAVGIGEVNIFLQNQIQQLRPEIEGQPYAESEFGSHIGSQLDLDHYWEQMENKVKRARDEVKSRRPRVLNEERKKYTERVTRRRGNLAGLLDDLESDEELYKKARDEVKKQLAANPVMSRDRAREGGFIEQLAPRSGQSGRVKAFVAYLNNALSPRVTHEVLVEMDDLLGYLENEATRRASQLRTAIPDLEGYYQEGSTLEREEKSIPELRGDLSYSVPLRLSALHLTETELKRGYLGVAPVEKLYQFLTRDKFDEKGILIDAVVEGFVKWLQENEALEALTEATGERIAAMAVDYFTQRFEEELSKMSVVDMIQQFVQDGRADDTYFFRNHLQWAFANLRPLLVRNPEAYAEGTENVVGALNVAVPLDQTQQKMRDLIVEMVPRPPSAIETTTCDPHRIQVLYSEHGISLSIIPTFFDASGDTCLHALLANIERTRGGAANAKSAFSCEVMAQLVLDEMDLPNKIKRKG